MNYLDTLLAIFGVFALLAIGYAANSAVVSFRENAPVRTLKLIDKALSAHAKMLINQQEVSEADLRIQANNIRFASIQKRLAAAQTVVIPETVSVDVKPSP